MHFITSIRDFGFPANEYAGYTMQNTHYYIRMETTNDDSRLKIDTTKHTYTHSLFILKYTIFDFNDELLNVHRLCAT